MRTLAEVRGLAGEEEEVSGGVVLRGEGVTDVVAMCLVVEVRVRWCFCAGVVGDICGCCEAGRQGFESCAGGEVMAGVPVKHQECVTCTCIETI